MTPGDLPRMIRAGEVGRITRGGTPRTVEQVLAEASARMDAEDAALDPVRYVSAGPRKRTLWSRLFGR
jgi:hypothetical protein